MYIASFIIHVKQLKTAKCKMIAIALHAEPSDIISSTSLRSSVTSSKRTANVKFIIIKIVVDNSSFCGEFKVRKSEIRVKIAPIADIEHPTRVNMRKMSWLASYSGAPLFGSCKQKRFFTEHAYWSI